MGEQGKVSRYLFFPTVPARALAVTRSEMVPTYYMKNGTILIKEYILGQIAFP